MRGSSSHQKPSSPVGAGVLTRPPLSQHPPTKAAWVPTDVVRYSTLSTAVAQKGPRVAQTQAAGNKRDTPESFTRGIPQQHRIPILLYRTTPRFPLVYLFFFGVQNRFFLFPEKKKRFWPPPGKRKTIPRRAGKRKSAFPRKMHAPPIRRPSRATSARPSRKPPTKAAWIPTNKERYSTHSTAVAQGGPRVAQTQAAEDRRIAQRILPEEQPNKIGPPSCCTAPPQNFRRSTFSFSESRTAFSFAVQKKKWFWPPPGRQKTTAR